MKTVLILVASTNQAEVQGTGPAYHYRALVDTALATWDAEEVPGVETIFYFGRCNGQANTDKFIYVDAEDEGLFNMGRKELLAFEYALANRQFDFVFLANLSLYVDKRGLLAYVQDKETENLALGLAVQHVDKPLPFLWGPARLLSRDVVKEVVDAKYRWNHHVMEDVALSYVLHSAGVQLQTPIQMASVAELPDGTTETTYYGPKEGQFAFRCKQDGRRERDIVLMQQLHAAFTKDSK